MAWATLRFYAELNDFLPQTIRQAAVRYRLNGPVAVKHAIEALGIPHTEVALILVSGQPVGFSHLMRSGEHLSIFPAFRKIDISAVSLLRPPSPFPPRFVLDGHLGQLATYLRLFDFDTLYRNDYDDEELAAISAEQERVLLTRDRRLLMRKMVTYGYFLRSKDPRLQLEAVLDRYVLRDHLSPWRRCLRCNGRLDPVSKEAIWHRLEPKTKKYYDEFRMCQECQQIYWKGSHFKPLQELVNSIGH